MLIPVLTTFPLPLGYMADILGGGFILSLAGLRRPEHCPTGHYLAMSILTTGHRALSGWHRPPVANAAVMFTLALVSAVGLLVDDRLLLRESVWLKPLKFGFAMGVYAVTLAWLLGKLTKGRRIGWWLGTVFAVAGVLDVGAVAYAAANGTFSHFNLNTDPVARTVQTVSSFGIMPLLLATLIIAALLLFQRIGDPALTRALRAGLGLALASMVVAL